MHVEHFPDRPDATSAHPRGSAAVTTLMTRQVRAVAAVTFVVTALAAGAFATGAVAVGFLLAGVQAAAFVTAIRTPGRHPYRVPARSIGRWFPAGEAEHPLPLRFAAQVGLGFMVVTLLAAVFSAPLAAVFAAACAGAAALNAFANLCIACHLYPRVQLLRSRLGILTR
jgi:hypothetical protein